MLFVVKLFDKIIPGICFLVFSPNHYGLGFRKFETTETTRMSSESTLDLESTTSKIFQPEKLQ